MHACVLVHVQTWFKQYYNVSQKSIITGHIYVDLTWSFHLSGLIFHILNKEIIPAPSTSKLNGITHLKA